MEKQPSNRAENQIRPFTVGRKNWLFSDTPAGAKASAVIYSNVETAKANSLVPRDYGLLTVNYKFSLVRSRELESLAL